MLENSNERMNGQLNRVYCRRNIGNRHRRFVKGEAIGSLSYIKIIYIFYFVELIPIF